MELGKTISKYDDQSGFNGLSLSGGSKMDELESKGEVIKPKLNTRKLSTDSGLAQVWVEDDQITISRAENGVCINKDNVIIAGKLHIANDIQKLRVNGFWTFNEELLTCLPSTTYTPIPVLLYTDPPYAKRAGALMSLLGG